MNQYLERLIWISEELEQKKKDNEDKISVNEFVGKMAFIYEKMRNSFDFKDAHILRKNAVHRILKRYFFLSNDASRIGDHLVTEMVRGGYLANDTVTKSKVLEVVKIVSKYTALKDAMVFKVKQKNKVAAWLLDMAACEIDETLVSPEKDEALVDLMYQEMDLRVTLTNSSLSEKEYAIFLYIAVLRAIRKLDKSLIEYNLLKFYSPNWKSYGPENAKVIANKIAKAKEIIERKAKLPVMEKMFVAVKKQVPPYRIIKEIIEEEPAKAREIFYNPDLLIKTIDETAKAKYKKTRSVLARSALRAIIYVLLTKVILAIALEMPYEFFVLKEYNYPALMVNILFHPILLFFLAVTARVPKDKNTELLQERISQILKGKYKDLEAIRIRVPQPSVKRSVFNIVYLMVTAGLFGLIVWGLVGFGFNWVSIVLFAVFLSVVSFLGFRVRGLVNEYKIQPPRRGAIKAFFDFLFFPILQTGKFLSINFSRINVFVMFLDIAFEAPYKIILQYLDEWFSFLREKRDEIMD